MFAHLIDGLRRAGLPTSITEYLTLLGADEGRRGGMERR